MRVRAFIPAIAKIALLVTSLSVSLILGEVALRWLGYQAIFEVYSKPSVLWQYDALLGWSHEPMAETHYVGPRPWPIEFDTPVVMNSLGLRGPELMPLPTDGVRILVLGDSMLAGFEVMREETFTAVTESLLTESAEHPVQVVNAVVRGYGTDQSLLYYRHKGHAFQADVVVLWLSVNDLVNDVTIHRMRRIFAKPAFVPDGPDGLRLLGSPVPVYPRCSEYRVSSDYKIVRLDSRKARLICRMQMELFDRSALFSFLTHLVPWESWGDLLRRLYFAGMPEPDSESGERMGTSEAITNRILETMAREVQARGSRFVLVSTPAMLQRFEDAGVELAGFRIISLDRLETTAKGELRFKHDSHLNARGHRIVAEMMTDYLSPVLREIRSRRGRNRVGDS